MRLSLPLLVLLALLVVGAAPAAASTGPCVVGTTGGPTCTVYRGSVPYQANDGDTLDVRLDGRRGLTRVRLADVQAMELTDYGAVRAGECHAVDAAQRVDELLDLAGRRVRLAALDPSSQSRYRDLRSVAVKVAGRWIDVGQQLIAEGLALWLPYPSEWEWNATYSRVARVASLVGTQGLWKPDACGAGPAEGVPLQVWVSSDPAGSDVDALNEEYVTVRNRDAAQPVDLSGWWVRDSALNRYTFAPGTVVPPGSHLTVRVGSGIDTPTDRFWGMRRSIFNNAELRPARAGRRRLPVRPPGRPARRHGLPVPAALLGPGARAPCACGRTPGAPSG